MACGSSADSGSAADPRCAALCEPAGKTPTDGTGDYCNAPSVTQCKQVCGVQIQGATTLCASCLLEKATFGSLDSAGPSQVDCDPSGCTLRNNTTGKMCTYPANDADAREACRKMLFPATMVDCAAPHFRPVTDCNSVCLNGTK